MAVGQEMVELNGVAKTYRVGRGEAGQPALKNVSLRVRSGEIVGLLGPNGAGKTTLLKILTGYLQPDEGTVTVEGIDVVENPRAAQARIGYLPENAPVYPELSVQGYLNMIADLRGIPAGERCERMSQAIYATGLQDRLTQPIGQLSKGFRQRVGLAQAILHRPPLLILDEPSVGLDPTQIVEMRHLIQRLAEHSTMLVLDAHPERGGGAVPARADPDQRRDPRRCPVERPAVEQRRDPGAECAGARGRRPAEGAAGGAERDADCVGRGVSGVPDPGR